MKVLLLADLHLRADRPACRTDENWIETQRENLIEVGKIAHAKNCNEVWLMGDVFHRPEEPASIVNMAMLEMSAWNLPIRSIYGNHDLKFHSIDNAPESSLTTLRLAGVVKTFDDVRAHLIAFDFGCDDDFCIGDIMITHRLVFPNEFEKGLAGGQTSEELYKQYSNCKVILMGDYHKGWTANINGQLQIMIGCMNIQSGKLEHYNPRAVIFDTETFETDNVLLTDYHENVNTSHLVEAKDRASRLEKCKQSLGSVETTDFDFRANLDSLTSSNNIVSKEKIELTNYLDEENK